MAEDSIVADKPPCGNMVPTMEVEEKDYLQVFTLTKTANRSKHIVHEQEQPPYRYELDVPCDDAVNAKVFVIDDLTIFYYAAC